jgi:formylmethanofuran dehydrogenase subunit C
VYGSSGDYLASGIDGMEIRVHGNVQDPLGQIMKQGRLVVYGDVGQTFLYGISVEKDLLRVGGETLPPEKVYRKVQPVSVEVQEGLEE